MLWWFRYLYLCTSYHSSAASARATKAACSAFPTRMELSIAAAPLVMPANERDSFQKQLADSPTSLVHHGSVDSNRGADTPAETRMAEPVNVESWSQFDMETTDAPELRVAGRALSLGSFHSLADRLLGEEPTSSDAVSNTEPGNRARSSSLSVMKAAAVFSAAKKLVQVKDNLSEFQKKGGIVGWLHGDEDENESPTAIQQANSTIANCNSAWSPPLSPGSSPRVGQADDGLHTPPSPSPVKGAAASQQGTAISPAAYESMFDKVIKASSPAAKSKSPRGTFLFSRSRSKSSPPSSPTRVSLKPSPRRKVARDAIVSAFDDFVNADGVGQKSKASTICQQLSTASASHRGYVCCCMHSSFEIADPARVLSLRTISPHPVRPYLRDHHWTEHVRSQTISQVRVWRTGASH